MLPSSPGSTQAMCWSLSRPSLELQGQGQHMAIRSLVRWYRLSLVSSILYFNSARTAPASRLALGADLSAGYKCTERWVASSIREILKVILALNVCFRLIMNMASRQRGISASKLSGLLLDKVYPAFINFTTKCGKMPSGR